MSEADAVETWVSAALPPVAPMSVLVEVLMVIGVVVPGVAVE